MLSTVQAQVQAKATQATAVQQTRQQTSTMRFDQIDFTKAGWKQFCKVNHGLGARFIRAFILKRELAAYLVAHDQAGVHLDTDCQEVHYADGVYLLLRKVQGTWYITDVILAEEPEGFAPLYIWTTIKRGVAHLLARVLVGWRDLIGKQDGKQVAQA